MSGLLDLEDLLSFADPNPEEFERGAEDPGQGHVQDGMSECGDDGEDFYLLPEETRGQESCGGGEGVQGEERGSVIYGDRPRDGHPGVECRSSMCRSRHSIIDGVEPAGRPVEGSDSVTSVSIEQQSGVDSHLALEDNGQKGGESGGDADIDLSSLLQDSDGEDKDLKRVSKGVDFGRTGNDGELFSGLKEGIRNQVTSNHVAVWRPDEVGPEKGHDDVAGGEVGYSTFEYGYPFHNQEGEDDTGGESPWQFIAVDDGVRDGVGMSRCEGSPQIEFLDDVWRSCESPAAHCSAEIVTSQSADQDIAFLISANSKLNVRVSAHPVDQQEAHVAPDGKYKSIIQDGALQGGCGRKGYKRKLESIHTPQVCSNGDHKRRGGDQKSASFLISNRHVGSSCSTKTSAIVESVACKKVRTLLPGKVINRDERGYILRTRCVEVEKSDLVSNQDSDVVGGPGRVSCGRGNKSSIGRGSLKMNRASRFKENNIDSVDPVLSVGKANFCNKAVQASGVMVPSSLEIDAEVKYVSVRSHRT